MGARVATILTPRAASRTELIAATWLPAESRRPSFRAACGCVGVRVATPAADPSAPWVVHAWAKQAILLYFGLRNMQTMEVGPFEYYDKIPLKRGWAELGVRV